MIIHLLYNEIVNSIETYHTFGFIRIYKEIL